MSQNLRTAASTSKLEPDTLEHRSFLLPAYNPAPLKITFDFQYPDCGFYRLFCFRLSFMIIREQVAFIIKIFNLFQYFLLLETLFSILVFLQNTSIVLFLLY